MNATTALEYIQEQEVKPLVENDNQKHICRWVRKYLLLLSGRGDYMDWELCQSVEGRIFLKSSCTRIHENFGVQNTTLQRYRNLIFLSFNCSSPKFLWYIIS